MRAGKLAAVLVVAGTLSSELACSGAGDGGDGGCTESATQPCYPGPEATRAVGTCKEGLQTCTAGQWGECVGSVLPAVESPDCDHLDTDCDGAVDEEFVTDTNPDCWADLDTSIPFISGDTGNESYGVWGETERFLRVRFAEFWNEARPLTGHICLTSPPGANFGLIVYCGACEGRHVASTWSTGLEEHTDCVNFFAADQWGKNDGFNLIVKIEALDLATCGRWALWIEGHARLPDVLSVSCD